MDWNYILFSFDGMNRPVPVKTPLRHTANIMGETEGGYSSIRVKPKARYR